MTLVEFCGKGYKTLCYTPQGGKSIKFNMCNKKDFKMIRNLIKNPPEGTTWRILDCDMVQERKMQKPGRRCAAGFTTASGDNRSVKERSIKVVKTTKIRGKKFAASENVDDGKAASDGSTTNVRSSKGDILKQEDFHKHKSENG